MNIPATIAEIASLPLEDRIRIVQAIWDTIAAEPEHPGLTDAQKKDLDRRVAELDANPENVRAWEAIRAGIVERRGEEKASVG